MSLSLKSQIVRVIRIRMHTTMHRIEGLLGKTVNLVTFICVVERNGFEALIVLCIVG